MSRTEKLIIVRRRFRSSLFPTMAFAAICHSEVASATEESRCGLSRFQIPDSRFPVPRSPHLAPCIRLSDALTYMMP